jgi:hypothetical protein
MENNADQNVKDIIDKIKRWFRDTVKPDFNFDVILDVDDTYKIIKTD